jgi:DNA-binding SARP family transcriptional activator/tetratricopeptide (TPR) repeat protein
MTTLRVSLFGGLSLTWDRTPLPSIPGTTARSLLAYLLMHRDRPHTRDLLNGTFWPELPEATARRRLSQALWQIRKTLDPHPILLAEGDTVQIDPTLPLWIDVEEFQGQVNRYTKEHPPLSLSTCPSSTNLSELDKAITLYRGEFLAGYYDDWLLVERERLREVFLATLAHLAEGHKAQGEYEQALLYTRRLASEDPWREEAHREAMRLCHLLGRDAEALKQFELCRQILVEELGAEPSPETVALAAEIGSGVGGAEPPLLPTAAQPAVVSLLDRPDCLPLVGRQPELARLLRHLEAAARGNGGLILVHGEAGVGKSRLAHELARNARWRDIRAVWGRCYELASPPAYQPLVEALRAGLPALQASSLEPLWLAELARLLPELASDGVLPVSLLPAEEQRHLLEAIARGILALGRAAPHLLLLEDAHWMDPASLEALRYLLPRLADAPLLVILTVRTEELAGPQAAALTALENTHLPRRLDLARLDQDETGELVRQALGLKQAAPRFSARLYTETEGNPFFLIETLRGLMDEGLLRRNTSGTWSTPWDEATQDYAELLLPAGVAQSIQRRLDRLPPPLAEALDLAAVIGRGVAFDLWQQVTNQPESNLLAAGDELCAKGLLLPAEATGADYVFAHDQIRRVTYERLAAPRRRVYHRRVAEALARLTPDEPDALAYHWTQAGVWDQAAAYHHQAGDRASAVYANAEAVMHYSQALEALARLPGPDDLDRLFELRLAREAVCACLGERAAQAGDLAALESLAEQLDDDRRRIVVILRQAEYYVDTSHLPEARRCLDRALPLARAVGDQESEAKALGLLGHVHLYLGDFGLARQYNEQALAKWQASSNRTREAGCLSACSVVCQMSGDYPAAQDYGHQALALCRSLGDQRNEGHILYLIGRIYRDMGLLSTAREYSSQAVDIVRLIGDRLVEAYHLLELGNLHANLGDYPAAQEALERAATIFQQTGERRGYSYALLDLGLVYLTLGRSDTARDHIERGWGFLSTTGDRWGEAGALGYLGLVLEEMGELDAAADAFRRALALKHEIGQQAWAMEDQSGLARIALVQDRRTEARQQVTEILERLTGEGVSGLIRPFLAYLTVYQVLAATGEKKKAKAVLGEAYALLMERAGQLDDEEIRRSYLENVPEHRELVAAYRGRQGERHQRCISARVPRADAPTGRPLRDDEYVNISWTVATPDDADITDEGDRRRCRLLRLLHQAAEQSAAPTVDDLAAALDVSRATLKRDLAALRRAGHEIRTRGSKP